MDAPIIVINQTSESSIAIAWNALANLTVMGGS